MKRKISDVRREVRELESELTHLIITNAAQRDFRISDRQEKITKQLDQLKAEYPNWERPIRIK